MKCTYLTKLRNSVYFWYIIGISSLFVNKKFMILNNIEDICFTSLSFDFDDFRRLVEFIRND